MYALEIQASTSMKRVAGRGETVLHRARREQVELVGKMTRKGVLTEDTEDAGETVGGVSSMEAHRQARGLSVQIGGLPYEEGTAAALDAPPVHYEPGRTGGVGNLPPMSLAGYIANLARAVDPLDPLAVTPVDLKAGEHAARVLGTAITQTN